MRSILLASLPLALTLASAPQALAGDCVGTPGYELLMPAEVAIGKPFDTCITAPGNSFVLVLISASSNPIPTKYGTLCVNLPFLTMWHFVMPPSGNLCLPHLVECEPAVVGFTGHFQFVSIGPSPGTFGLSNGQSLTAIDDGSCDDCEELEQGDFVTFSQGGWGTKCAGNNPGCLRDEYFDVSLPGGLLLGDQDGIDGDNRFAVLLSTSKAVQDFLPSGGPSAKLAADVIDPTDKVGGSLAAQLAAAKLSVAFDDAGAFDSIKNQTAVKLGDLVFAQDAPSKLLGWTVRDVIDLADRALSGELSAPIDVDNDGNGDVSLSELAGALDALNNNFDGGDANNGVLQLP
jgi:hypothetical protein